MQTFTQTLYKWSCVECRPWESQLYFYNMWVEAGGLLHSTFFNSGSAFFFFYPRHVLLLHNTPPQRKTQLALQCWFRVRIWKTYGAVAKPLYCCSCLFGHILGEGCTDGTCHSEWLAFAAAGAENLHSGEGKNAEKGASLGAGCSWRAGRDERHRQAVC